MAPWAEILSSQLSPSVGAEKESFFFSEQADT